ncbi:MAG: ATPase, T2SS/T4P/T4SS family [Nitrospirota bacterium]
MSIQKPALKIGDLLIKNGLISESQLQEALARQKELKEKGEVALLGNVLVEMKILTATQLLKFLHRHAIKPPLGEILLLDKKITKRDLANALALQERYPDRKLGDILINDLKVISDDVLTAAIAKQNDISRIKPAISDVDPDVLFAFSKETLLSNMFVPYKKIETENGEISCQILISTPGRGDLRKIEDMVGAAIVRAQRSNGASASGNGAQPKKVQFEYALASADEIRTFIATVFEQKEAISFSRKVNVEANEASNILMIGSKYYSTNSNLNIFMQILMKALDAGASDVHIEPMRDRLQIRFRIDGVLIRQPDLPKTLNSVFVRGLKNFFRMKDSHMLNVILDGRKSVLYSDKNVEADLRISVLPTLFGDKMVVRILVQNKEVPTFEKLGMCKNILKKYKMVCSSSSGIVIITGPTGSGKTTTLFSTIDYLSNENVSILTLEDPPEYVIHGVSQAVVGGEGKREINYAEALKGALRQDPDIIMFGEMRDFESANVALNAGLTGHLLFSTLHTNDSASAITRIFEMGIRPFMLSSTLVSILGQRLVRVICKECKEEYEVSSDELEFFDMFIRNFQRDTESGAMKFYRGRGCKECNYTGFKGRIAIHELLCVNDEIRRVVLSVGTAKDVAAIARAYGMTSMIEDGAFKALQGMTTLEEVIRVAKTLENPEDRRTMEEISHLLEGELTREELLLAVYSSRLKEK